MVWVVEDERVERNASLCMGIGASEMYPTWGGESECGKERIDTRETHDTGY